MRPSNKTLESIFHKNTPAGNPNDCWEWSGKRIITGYGMLATFRDKGTPVFIYAHRFAWELHNGPIPAGMCVCHHCDNPPCVNPAHLFLGTQSDNSLDMIRKGRCRVINRMLSDEWIPFIRQCYSAGFPQRAIGKYFGLSQRSISAVCSRTTYRHIP